MIGAEMHSWRPYPMGNPLMFDAPYTDDPFGIRYDYFDPATVLFLTRPANLLPAPAPKPEADVDDQFICANPTGGGDYLCSWSTRIAVGIPNPAVRDELLTQGAKRFNLTAQAFTYFQRKNWSTP